MTQPIDNLEALRAAQSAGVPVDEALADSIVAAAAAAAEQPAELPWPHDRDE